jgi:hypothetical protein
LKLGPFKLWVIWIQLVQPHQCGLAWNVRPIIAWFARRCVACTLVK